MESALTTEPAVRTPPALPENEVHVWLAQPALHDHAQLEARYLSLLSADEREQHRKFHFAKERHPYLAAHALIRLVLSRYAALPPAQIHFSRGKNGKPRAELPAPYAALTCNLTHTAGLVGCVIARGRECGIDIETRRTLDDMDGVARLMCSTDERRHLASLAAPARHHHFFTLWTLKEAYAKATGEGIGSDLTQVSFAVDDDAVRCSIGSGAPQGEWWFHSSSPSSEHALAVALRSPLKNTSVVVKEFQL
jgi:4'-phosphopantetheinyl transferase